MDADSLGPLEKATNEAASKLSALWTTFVTFELYLAISFGSVSHQDIFLQTAIKLPILGAELPLTAFFAVAPILLVIFHFYIFIQLFGLSTKASEYNKEIAKSYKFESERQCARQRLDPFLILQFLAGPKRQRTGFQGLSLRLIAWITLIGAPILIILQAQIVFLPYHGPLVTWAQRLTLIADLALIQRFWNQIRSEDTFVVRSKTSYISSLKGIISSIILIIFSIWVVNYPGERAHDRLPSLRVIPWVEKRLWAKAWPSGQFGFYQLWLQHGEWTSLSEALLSGAVDEVSGRPMSLYSNRIILTDKVLVETSKLERPESVLSVRGRDLRGAVLNRTDLRQVDFTGADLREASFVGAKLQKARMGCALDDAERGCTILRGANLEAAKLQGTSLRRAELQGARLNNAELSSETDLFAARFIGGDLRGAHLDRVKVDGSDFRGASFTGAEISKGLLTASVRLEGTAFSDRSLEDAGLQDHPDASKIWTREKGSKSENDIQSQFQNKHAEVLLFLLDCRNNIYLDDPDLRDLRDISDSRIVTDIGLRKYIVRGFIQNGQLSHLGPYSDLLLAASTKTCSEPIYKE